MGRLKPIGSEKLEGSEKIKRIMEIARYNEIVPKPINENSSVEYSIMLADGATYQINKEKTGYVIKKSINEGTFDYIEPMKNRSHYSSYSQAFKRLNLIAKEVNTLTGNDSEISLFSEQKKFTLKTPTPAAAPSPETAPAPDMGMDTPPPSDDAPAPDMDMDAPSPDMGGDDLPMPSDDSPESDMGGEDGEEMSIKSIQKLTGKLGQKIRSYSSEEELTSDDAKYIINSILSAIDLSILDDEDKEDIMAKFDGEEDMDSDMDVESPESPDMGGEEELPEPEMGGEMAEMDTLGGIFSNKFKSNFAGALSDKLESHEAHGMSKIMDEVFNESKVEKIITKYFKIDEKEKKMVESKNKTKVLTESKKSAHTYIQETAAEKLINKYPNLTLIGKSNKNNLVFQLEGKKIRITPEGRVL